MAPRKDESQKSRNYNRRTKQSKSVSAMEDEFNRSMNLRSARTKGAEFCSDGKLTSKSGVASGRRSSTKARSTKPLIAASQSRSRNRFSDLEVENETADSDTDRSIGFGLDSESETLEGDSHVKNAKV